FDWSPYWDAACPTGRLDKAASDGKLDVFLRDQLAPAAKTVAVSGWDQSGFGLGQPLARFTVTRLGELGAGASRRGVVGIFVDTSDRGDPDYGIAGAYGTFSRKQKEKILAAVETEKASLNDPWFVVFAHIPYRELTSAGQQELGALIAALDGGGA